MPRPPDSRPRNSRAPRAEDRRGRNEGRERRTSAVNLVRPTAEPRPGLVLLAAMPAVASDRVLRAGGTVVDGSLGGGSPRWVSVLLDLKGSRGSDGRVLFDAVSLVEQPLPLFADDFETGNLELWSSVVGSP